MECSYTAGGNVSWCSHYGKQHEESSKKPITELPIWSSNPTPGCVCVCVLVTQLCLTWCDPMDCSPLGSSVHGVSQVRMLKWVAISFSRGSPGIYQDKTVIQKDTCTFMFIAAWFTIAKTWKESKCPLTKERGKKMWYIYTMVYYLAIKKRTK